MADRQDTSDAADEFLAQYLSSEIQSLMSATAELAALIGTKVTLPQVLAGVLAHGQGSIDRPLTRDEFNHVFDVVETLRAARPAPKQLPAGPEATAHAASAEEAGQLAESWGKLISDVAFGTGFPGFIGDTDG